MPSSQGQAKVPAIWLLIALTAVNSIALNMFVPAMPLAAAEFGASMDTISLTLTLYLLGVGLAQLFYGPLSDRFGRRRIVIGGTAFFLVASLACALAPSPDLLIVGRLVQAFGGCAGLVISRAIVRDVWDADRAVSVLGKIMTVMAVAPALSPVIGAWLGSEFGWRSIFFLVAAVGAAVWLCSLVGLPETNHQRLALPRIGAVLRSYGTVLRDPVFYGFTLATSMVTACWFAFLSAGPFIMQHVMNRPPFEFGFVFGALAFAYIVGTVSASRLAGRVSRLRVMAGGLSVSAFGAVLMLVLSMVGIADVVTMTVCMFLICMGHGLNSPNAVSLAIGVRPEMRGTASGLFGAIQMACAALSTLLSGWFSQDQMSLSILETAIAALALLAFVPGALAYRRVRPPN